MDKFVVKRLLEESSACRRLKVGAEDGVLPNTHERGERISVGDKKKGDLHADSSEQKMPHMDGELKGHSSDEAAHVYSPWL